jgi:uncharacterized protein (TIRG00374 family)
MASLKKDEKTNQAVSPEAEEGSSLESKDSSEEEENLPLQAQQEEESYEKANKRKLVSNIVFMLGMTALVLILFLSLGELDKIGDTFKEISNGSNYIYLLIAIGLSLVYFAIYPFSLCILDRAMKTNATYADSYLIGCSEHFFNDITPFAAGGQPFQIYSYVKKNVPTDQATGLVLMNFTIFLIVVNAFNVASLFFFPDYVRAMDSLNLSWLKWVSLVGLIFNIGFLVFVIFLAFSRHMAGFLIKVMKQLCRIKFIGKFLTKQIPVFEQFCQNVQIVTRGLMEHKWAAFWALIVKGVAYIIYYIIPFFLMKAVGVEISYDQIYIVSLSAAFASAAANWLPTPGATGGIEYAFALVLASVAPNVMSGTSKAITLLWRMLTFYLPMLLSGLTNLIFEGKFNAAMKKQMKALKKLRAEHEVIFKEREAEKVRKDKEKEEDK